MPYSSVVTAQQGNNKLLPCG